MQRILAFLVLLLPASLAVANAPKASNPYPNELPGYKLYAKYLNPLRPNVSDLDQVIRVLGSDQGHQIGRWWILPLFIGDENHATGRLASVEISPRRRVSMLGVKFPALFSHSLGSVSEVNVTCDVYGDSYGLEYWLYAEDSPAGKKGDLMKIEYGPGNSLK
jgi:hypothetical protein